MKPRVYPRDVTCLRWVGEQYAVSLDHLQILFSRLSARPTQIAMDVIHIVNVKKIVERWVKNGWAVCGGVSFESVVAVVEPEWVHLTRKGYQLAGLKMPYIEPSLGRLTHYWYTNAVRLYVEFTLDLDWICERVANVQRGRMKKHLVDGEILTTNGRTAVEVELHKKSKRKLRLILRRLKRDYERVWYFAKNSAYTTVQNTAQDVDSNQEVIKIYRLADILD